MKNLIDFVAAVQDNARGEAQPGEPMRYLLVDHAGAPGLMQALQRRPSLTWTSLFEDSKEVGALEVAPILIRLPDARANFVEREFLEWLYRACQYSTSVTALHSAWERDRLASALRTRLDMMLPDGMPVMLRYFDTRALESLLRVLTAEQQGQFLGVASRWQWLGRAGELHQRHTEQLTTDPWPHRLEIDVTQQNALIESGEADALVAQMNAQAPDLCRHEQRADLHALAERCASKFGPLGIDDIRTQALYCLTALELGSDFDSQPGWAEVLARVAKKQISFEAALGEMGA
jgi:Domain of unknown function (DUF4123)